MSYLVLARKYRPRSFDTLIGQEHVVRALTHALSTQRLHHAWLFTGTRGVGKTTLSRILAKSLNCETGITASPCGKCQACTEIDAGRFVDYVELDAASNRGVDEMTQLLEQAVYAPGAGRFKVYMIDEVHMLTGHAFNAMLKTLEEPPPHVKFILATTDPQKIPVTVLSRCLQFNLKQMTGEAIVAHLQQVLAEEKLAFEIPALRLIGRAAAGSMRDALSLTDQAIAYSAGNLTAEAVQGMLGTIDQRHLADLLEALARADAARVIGVADELAVRGLSYAGALADLSILLSRIAVAQRLGRVVPEDDPLADDIAALGRQLHPDQVQLFYSVAVHSRQELSLAPDEYAGFVMACLRMLALGDGPQGVEPVRIASPAQAAGAGDAPAGPVAAEVPATPVTAQVARVVVTADHAGQSQGQMTADAATPAPPVDAAGVAACDEPPPAWEDLPAPMSPEASDGVSPPAEASLVGDTSPPDAGSSSPQACADLPDAASGMTAAPAMPDVDEDGIPYDLSMDDVDARFERVGIDDLPMHDDGLPEGDDMGMARLAGAALGEVAPSWSPAAQERLRDMTRERWPALAARLPVTGLAAELARQSEWIGSNESQVHLRVAVQTLAQTQGRARLRTVLSEHFGLAVDLQVEYGVTGEETAHAVAQAERAARQARAEQAADADPFVQTLVREFGGCIVPGTVRPGAAGIPAAR